MPSQANPNKSYLLFLEAIQAYSKREAQQGRWPTRGSTNLALYTTRRLDSCTRHILLLHGNLCRKSRDQAATIIPAALCALYDSTSSGGGCANLWPVDTFKKYS